jgi:hypothetical protein
MQIHMNTFVGRQTPESRFSHFEGEEGALIDLVVSNFDTAREGYREGVLEVDVNPVGFRSGVAMLADGDTLTGAFEARRNGEDPRKVVVVNGREKLPAKSVTVILYASTVLAEDTSNELEAVEGNYEVVSINANPFDGDEPIDPMVLMHNHFGSTGGTDTNLSDEDFVALLRTGFEFWKDKAMCG